MDKKASVISFLIVMIIFLMVIGLVSIIFAPKISSVSKSFFSQFDKECPGTGKKLDYYVLKINEIYDTQANPNDKVLKSELQTMESCWPGITKRLDEIFPDYRAEKLEEIIKPKAKTGVVKA